MGEKQFNTRHQLLVHPDIPYTSHDSAMCFRIALYEDCPLDRLIEHASCFLGQESAPGSDPGLCVANSVTLSDPRPLLEFGQSAKREVLTKSAAYALARQAGIHLSEHGGNGQGVVGALAGVGLRLGGNDRQLRGKLNLGPSGEMRTVASLQNHPLVDTILGIDGATSSAAEKVMLGEKIKTVLLEGKSVLPLERTDGSDVHWPTCSRLQLRNY